MGVEPYSELGLDTGPKALSRGRAHISALDQDRNGPGTRVPRKPRATRGAPGFREGRAGAAPAVRCIPGRPDTCGMASTPRQRAGGLRPAGSDVRRTEVTPARPRIRPHLEVTFFGACTAEGSSREEAENPTWLGVGDDSRQRGVATERVKQISLLFFFKALFPRSCVLNIILERPPPPRLYSRYSMPFTNLHLKVVTVALLRLVNVLFRRNLRSYFV